MITLKEFQQQFTKALSDLYPATEITSFLSIILEEYFHLQRIDLVMNPSFEISQGKLDKLYSVIERLKQQEPIQYIIGKTEFFGLPFFVNEHVLIPRPETEELVAWILEEVEKPESNKIVASLEILDIGTGSGCIPVALKKQLPDAKVSAIDVSAHALEVAKNNAEINDVEIQFILKDILATHKLDRKFDVIASNPPYVRTLEKVEIKSNVLDYEPELALFVEDDDPLLFYRKIASLAKDNLKENGVLFFEINQYLGQETVDLLKEIGFQHIQLKKDLFGNNRMIRAQF
jgi:release factor glutamine methyltransferase